MQELMNFMHKIHLKLYRIIGKRLKIVNTKKTNKVLNKTNFIIERKPYRTIIMPYKIKLNKLKSKIIQYNNKIHLLVSLLKKEIKLV